MARVGLKEWLAVGQVILSGRTVRYGERKGQYTDRFEKRLADFVGVKHAHTVNSGTSALICALVGAGVGPGDEVLAPAYTWVATAAAIASVGAVPVLVEIDESLTIDPNSIEDKITARTKAIIPVHMINLVCNMDAIMAIAARRNLLVIEDACQAVGARYKDKRVGAIGHVGVFSFNGHKNIDIGEGGAVLTNDDRIYERVRMYHDVGSYTRGHDNVKEPVFVGQNFKATEFDGAMLNAQLTKLSPMLRRLRVRRKKMAAIMSGSTQFSICPHHDEGNAIGLSVIFDRAADASAFANRRGVHRLLDRSRHVYLNWEPVLSKRVWHPHFDPWANTNVEYTAETCPHTLDILGRSCQITLGEQYPLPVMTYLARKYAKAEFNEAAVTAPARA